MGWEEAAAVLGASGGDRKSVSDTHESQVTFYLKVIFVVMDTSIDRCNDNVSTELQICIYGAV